LVTVNSHLNPDWGIQARDTMSYSLERFKNLTDRGNEALGKIDAAKLRDIFDLRLFNEDGTLKENGGASKPAQLDARHHQLHDGLGSEQSGGLAERPAAGHGLAACRSQTAVQLNLKDWET
ncbi:MAG: hypothetical protein WAN46_11360, partial [Gammaproteobacteria bacterium]